MNMPAHHYPSDRRVDCTCDPELGMMLLHYGRWSEVQAARCCGCGKVQAYIPVGDDPRTPNGSSAHRAVPLDASASEWLTQWPLLIGYPSDPLGPCWLPARTKAVSAGELKQRIASAEQEQRIHQPAARLRAAGFPAAPAPPVEHAQLQAALHAMDRWRAAMLGELPADAPSLFGLLGDHQVQRWAALEALLAHPDLHAQIDDTVLHGIHSPWLRTLLLLHWSMADAARWQRYLDALAAIPLTPMEGIAGYAHESFALGEIIEQLVRSDAPRAPLRACFAAILERSRRMDHQLSRKLTDRINALAP